MQYSYLCGCGLVAKLHLTLFQPHRLQPHRLIWGNGRPWHFRFRVFSFTYCDESASRQGLRAISGQHPLGTDAFSPTAHRERNLANHHWVSLEASFTPVELGVEPCSLCLHRHGSLAKDPAERETQLPHNLWDNIHVLSHANNFGKICYTATEK